MDKEEKEKAFNQFEEMSNGAKEEDVNKINDKIGGMNRGALKDIWDKVMLLWEMVKDPKVAWSSKAIAIGALIYTISPIDAIPDFIPIFGLTDDAAVIMAAIAALGVSLNKYKDKVGKI